MCRSFIIFVDEKTLINSLSIGEMRLKVTFHFWGTGSFIYVFRYFTCPNLSVSYLTVHVLFFFSAFPSELPAGGTAGAEQRLYCQDSEGSAVRYRGRGVSVVCPKV